MTQTATADPNDNLTSAGQLQRLAAAAGACVLLAALKLRLWVRAIASDGSITPCHRFRRASEIFSGASRSSRNRCPAFRARLVPFGSLTAIA
jgi:hypothetical protein